jgi:2-haloacid dehalogenase
VKLSHFEALSFDCYGTLIDWEAGIGAVLEPWAREHGLDIGAEELLERYASAEALEEARTPAARYP